jgi:hypothetical protein
MIVFRMARMRNSGNGPGYDTSPPPALTQATPVLPSAGYLFLREKYNVNVTDSM